MSPHSCSYIWLRQLVFVVISQPHRLLSSHCVHSGCCASHAQIVQRHGLEVWSSVRWYVRCSLRNLLNLQKKFYLLIFFFICLENLKCLFFIPLHPQVIILIGVVGINLVKACVNIFAVTWDLTALLSCSIVSTSYPDEKGVKAGVFWRWTVA